MEIGNSNHCSLGTKLSHCGLHGLCKNFCGTQNIHLLFSCQYYLGISLSGRCTMWGPLGLFCMELLKYSYSKCKLDIRL